MSEVKEMEPQQQVAQKSFDFSSEYSSNLPSLLKALNISIAVTSYQADRLFFLRTDGVKINTHFKYFPRPMGVCADAGRLTLGTLTQVLDFRHSEVVLNNIKNGQMDSEAKLSRKIKEDRQHIGELFRTRKEKEIQAFKQADALYLPRAALSTGMINIHDIAWGNEGLWVVNSTFSCLSTLSPDYSFVARWKPPFISELVPEDRCHLNGMALKDGYPKYVTTFNQCDNLDSWVDRPLGEGTLIDVDTDEILLKDLIMPHSPRYYRERVYLCDSGTGRVLEYDPATKTTQTLITLPGFPRGMNFIGNLMFVGLSKVRKSDIGATVPIAEALEESQCGVWVIDLDSQGIVGNIVFSGDVSQIYDIAVVRDAVTPDLAANNMVSIRHLFDYTEELA
ncbi:TIGR03032 family protein [Shewanella cyperi]|nr:TIGR03032 family protein [Shewanella cyperi]